MCDCKAPIIETAASAKQGKHDYVIISVYDYTGKRMTSFDNMLRTTASDDLDLRCSRCGVCLIGEVEVRD